LYFLARPVPAGAADSVALPTARGSMVGSRAAVDALQRLLATRLHSPRAG